MQRVEQILLISTFLAFCWLAMQVVHELGHVLGALATGGEVVRIVLHPAQISWTWVDPNPRPLIVVWAGPIIGALLPLALWAIAGLLRAPGLYLMRFFAGFCLIANGVYIGGGSFEGVADSGEMLRHGSSRWQLILFGLVAVPLGFVLWNGLGPAFGLGEAEGKVSRKAAIASTLLFLALVAAELAIWG